MRLGDPRLTLLLFAAVLVLFVVMGRYFPAALAVPLPGSTIRPVLLFEFTASRQDLIHIFGEPSDPLRAGRIAGMNTGNAIDFLLMPSYGFLTLSFFTGLSRQLSGNVWRLFGAMGIVAAVADAIENTLLFGITGNMADPLQEIALLPYPVWIKFGFLAITCGGAAWAFFRMQRWALGLLCLPAPLLIIPAWLSPMHIAPVATSLIGLGWLAMAIYVASLWWRNRQADRLAP